MNERIKGIDVSKYQKTIDWDQVHAQGVEFAFARVTDGTKVVDEYFAANWRRMREAGIVRGVYQFFRASQSAVEQARLLVDLVNDAGGFERDDLPPVIDVEDGGCKGVEAAVVVAGVKAWLAEVERLTGKVPIVYTGVGLWSTLGALGADKSFLRFPLWVYHANNEAIDPASLEAMALLAIHAHGRHSRDQGGGRRRLLRRYACRACGVC